MSHPLSKEMIDSVESEEKDWEACLKVLDNTIASCPKCGDECSITNNCCTPTILCNGKIYDTSPIWDSMGYLAISEFKKKKTSHLKLVA